MSNEEKFFIYLLENYSEFKNRKTGDVINEWKEKGIINYIFDNYWLYHTERMENAYIDIDSMIKTGKSAWADQNQTTSWQQRKQGEVVKEITLNDPESEAPIMMITVNNGFIEQSERYAFNNAGESFKKYILYKKG